VQSQYQKKLQDFSKRKESKGNLRLIDWLILKFVLFNVEAESVSPCLRHVQQFSVVYCKNRIMKFHGLILNIIFYLADI